MNILLAGFPCQAFSQAGLRKGFNNTRGRMFFEIQRILAGKKPKVFLLENVKQLRGHVKGNTLNTILNILEGRSTNDIPCDIPTRLGDILLPKKEIEEKYTISEKLWDGHQRRKLEHAKKGNGFGYSLFNYDSKYTNTLSARYYKDGSEILIDQTALGKRQRKLTPRECARLQGFPDNYIIDAVSDGQIYKQFGNFVSVPVIKAVAEKILLALGVAEKMKSKLISLRCKS